MRRYESIIVLDGGLKEEEIAAEVKKVEAVLAKRGADQIEHTDWGRRMVAYPLRKQSLGHYQRFEFSSDRSEAIKEATAELLLGNSILKMQTHKIISKVRKFKGNPRRTGSDGLLSGDDEEE
jgi:small subunit ribosomal protein S6